MGVVDTDRTMGKMSTELTTMTLDDLGKAAATESDATRQHLVGALARFVRLGEILLEARSRLDDQEWKVWCEKWGVNHVATSNAMRLAYYRDEIPAEAFQAWKGSDGKVRSPSINRCLAYVRGLPSLGERGSRVDDSVRAEALRLVRQGMSDRDVAELVGVSKTTVANWRDPHGYKRRRDRKNQRERQKARALKREEERKLAKATGGELAKSYSLIRQALAVLDKVATEPAGEAIRHLHRAEEAVVQAMRQQEDVA